MSETKFLLRDARDQINLELRKITRRVAAQVYAEIEAEVLEQNEHFVAIDVRPDAIRSRVFEAVGALD